MQRQGSIFQNVFFWVGFNSRNPQKVDFYAKKWGFIQEKKPKRYFSHTWGSIQEWRCIEADTVS